MIDVLLVCGKNGDFISCKAEGHAGFAAKGKDIVCAAVTELLRTAVQVLEKTGSYKVKSDAPSRGKLAFSVEDTKGASGDERLICTADFIRFGVKTLSEEYPENVQLRELTE